MGDDTEIEVISPNGGEVWAKRHQVDIRWQGGTDTDSVRIELLDGDAVIATIAESAPNTGVLESYVVAAELREGDGYRIRVSSEIDATVADESDGGFRIETREVAVTAPNGGEQVLAGEPFTVTWVTTGAVEEIDLEIVSDSGDVAGIARGVVDTGAYTWTPSFELAPASDYRVRILDPVAGISDESDSVFLLDNWRYRRLVTVTSSAQVADTDLAVLVELDPADLADAAADGADIRFASDPMRPNGHDIAHYIEQWSSTSGARIWVVLPALPAEGELTLHMFYGAPTAPATSDRDAAFPDRFVSSGDLTLTGDHELDSFRLRSNDTLYVEPGALLEIHARIIEINGWVDGNGAGYDGGWFGYVGSGPGGGGTSSTGGGGGGGYGGHGGYGGGDSGDAPGSGGPTYGGSTGSDVEMGSGGGGSDVNVGGDGGGALALFAHTVVIDGVIEMNGFAGESCVSSRCGGGGSGGGILVAAHEIHLTGALVAHGGHGGDGYGMTDDGGGGGGGGRIKLLYGGALEDAGSISVAGGNGGQGGNSTSDGQAGGEGTAHLQAQARWEPTAVVGAEVALFP